MSEGNRYFTDYDGVRIMMQADAGRMRRNEVKPAWNERAIEIVTDQMDDGFILDALAVVTLPGTMQTTSIQYLHHRMHAGDHIVSISFERTAVAVALAVHRMYYGRYDAALYPDELRITGETADRLRQLAWQIELAVQIAEGIVTAHNAR
ncbi:MAG: hypothetical protein JNJ61_25680 [Anaerolineae bacterium]|nr:hypothetical protein [Anaerolineae bacterium]